MVKPNLKPVAKKVLLDDFEKQIKEPKESDPVLFFHNPYEGVAQLSIDPRSTSADIRAEDGRMVIKMPYALIRNFVLDELRKTIIEDLKDMDHAEFEEWLRST